MERGREPSEAKARLCPLCRLLSSPYSLVPGLLPQLYTTSDFVASGLFLEGSFLLFSTYADSATAATWSEAEIPGVIQLGSLDPVWYPLSLPPACSWLKTQTPAGSSTHLLAKLVALEEGNLGLRSTLIPLDTNHSHRAWHRESALYWLGLCQIDTSYSYLGSGDINWEKCHTRLACRQPVVYFLN